MRLTYFRDIGSLSSSSGGTQNIDMFDGGSSTSSAGLFLACIPVSGDIANLKIRITAAPGGATARSFQVVVAGSNLGSPVAFGAADTVASQATIGAVTAGQRVQIIMTNTGSPAAASMELSFDLVATTINEYGYTSSLGGAPAAGVSAYLRAFGPARSGTETDIMEVALPVASPCTMTALMLGTHFGAMGAADEVYARVMKSTDGGVSFVEQDGTGGTVDTTVTLISVAQHVVNETTFSLPLARGDVIAIKIHTVQAYSGWHSYGTRFVADNDGEANISMGENPTGLPSGAVDNYTDFIHADGWAAADGTRIATMGLTGFTMKDPVVMVETAPGAGNSRTMTLRKNGSDTASSMTVSETDTGSIEGSGSASFVDGDTMSLRHVPVSSPDINGEFSWTWVFVDTETEFSSFARQARMWFD